MNKQLHTLQFSNGNEYGSAVIHDGKKYMPNVQPCKQPNIDGSIYWQTAVADDGEEILIQYQIQKMRGQSND